MINNILIHGKLLLKLFNMIIIIAIFIIIDIDSYFILLLINYLKLTTDSIYQKF